ncbi:MAG: hypothetical protein A2176_07975 [Spirochaetes bacterium RBG_13_51_14]|nr:MAG: hypothetical protein A2176_07975 [Spirochaetes bacterium RBG_13_51_14]
MKTIVDSIAVSLCVIFFLHCGKNIREMEAGPAHAKHKIIIAAFYSDFKETIVEGLVDRLKDKAMVTVVPLNKLEDIDVSAYHAVAIIDSLRAWKLFNVRTRSFIEKIKDPEEKKKIILFLSAGNPKKNYNIAGVDSITAASVRDSNREIVDALAAKIEAVLP